jgi:hypothetical protein
VAAAYNAGLGAVAGAAGTLALDAMTYADIALRGRRPSTMPAEMIRRIADAAGIEPLGKPDDQVDDRVKNRRSGLGALSGYAIGLTVGTTYGLMRPLTSKMPLWLQLLTLTVLMMSGTDVPATAVGATNPKKWGASGWLADILPHLGYALVATCVFALYERDEGPQAPR